MTLANGTKLVCLKTAMNAGQTSPMSARHVAWARQARERLRSLLGGRCRWCGSQRNLTLDCIDPKGHAHHASGVLARTVFYRAQWRVGNLQVLCEACNNLKGNMSGQQWRILCTLYPTVVRAQAGPQGTAGNTSPVAIAAARAVLREYVTSLTYSADPD